MSVTYNTGSVAKFNLKTATIENATLVGAGSFSEELTNTISGGYELDGIVASGSYIAFLHLKQ